MLVVVIVVKRTKPLSLIIMEVCGQSMHVSSLWLINAPVSPVSSVQVSV